MVFVREYRVLHSMLRNLMSLFIKSISLYNPIKFLAILYPKSLAKLVGEVGTRHSHQILLFLSSFVPDLEANTVVPELTIRDKERC